MWSIVKPPAEAANVFNDYETFCCVLLRLMVYWCSDVPRLIASCLPGITQIADYVQVSVGKHYQQNENALCTDTSKLFCHFAFVHDLEHWLQMNSWIIYYFLIAFVLISGVSIDDRCTPTRPVHLQQLAGLFHSQWAAKHLFMVPLIYLLGWFGNSRHEACRLTGRDEQRGNKRQNRAMWAQLSESIVSLRRRWWLLLIT